MASFSVRCPGPHGGPTCNFTGSGSTLSTARRAVRGHAFRLHSLVFETEEVPLRHIPPDKFHRRFDTFRRQPISAAQRRNFDKALLRDLGDANGVDGSVVGSIRVFRPVTVTCLGIRLSGQSTPGSQIFLRE